MNSREICISQCKSRYNDPIMYKEVTKRALKSLYVLTSLSSSSKVNSFFLTTLSWLRKLNSAAFFCNLANLFSYLETFFNVGLTLKCIKEFSVRFPVWLRLTTYNLPRRSLTWAFRSEICRCYSFRREERNILDWLEIDLNVNGNKLYKE